MVKYSFMMNIKNIINIMLLAVTGTLTFQVQAAVNYAQRPDVKAFIDEMVSDHGFDRAYLQNIFASAQRLDNVLESIARPAEKTLDWKQYRPIFVTEKRASRGREFMKQHHAALQRAEDVYGVPKEIIAAIIGVETYYGNHTGKYTVFDSLTTLGFDYPPRSKFFRSELKQFLLLSKEEDIDVRDMTGSYAGAMGMPQFISSSYRRYAVDFDGDGKRDLWHSIDDVIGSVANYFSVHGWEKGRGVVYPVTLSDPSIALDDNKLKPYETVANFRKQGVRFINTGDEKNIDPSSKATLLKLFGKDGDEYWLGLDNFYVITRYNHSDMYAMAVYQLSRKLK
jgi:membrane-bound lytic murein transglycosylase B